MKNILCSTAFAVCLGTSVFAQTVSDFENLSIPSGGVVLTDSVTNGTYFTFESGNVRFDAGKASWGGWELFNVSNDTSVTFSFPASMNSNITGGGHSGSSNFGVAFVNSDYMGNYDYIPVGAKLINNANRVSGVYVTNSSYTYDYIANSSFYNNNSGYFHLIIKGYNNGVESPDSVIVFLADYSLTTPKLLNSWEYADLTSLGIIDSLTFNLETNDVGAFGSNTPSYFVMDNLSTIATTSGCSDNITVSVDSVKHNSAKILWNLDNTFNGTDSIQLVINQSILIDSNDIVNTLTGMTSFQAENLDDNTNYYAHVRAFCTIGNEFNEWNTIPFTTTNGTGIKSINNFEVNVYPNPTSGIVHLVYALPLNVMVIDLNGKTIINKRNVRSIDMSTLADGSYLLQISDKEMKHQIIKMVIKK
ncbi:MAG TPA: DUF4465 domain-containing protein [Edaphocola sp.]|nr:DUF4465 domain-containing protein [Edaphocola sp.]